MAKAWNLNFSPKAVSKPIDDPGDFVTGVVLSQQHHRSVDLIQNCDLPPPLKIFPATDKTVADSRNRILLRNNPVQVAGEFNSLPSPDCFGRGDRRKVEELKLLRALRLSQTRAREAESRRLDMERERDYLSLAFQAEAMRIFGYRQLVMLLELEVAKLRQRRRWARQEVAEELEGRGDVGGCGGGGGGFSWAVAVAVALCLGAVGVGVAFGCSCRYFF